MKVQLLGCPTKLREIEQIPWTIPASFFPQICIEHLERSRHWELEQPTRQSSCPQETYMLGEMYDK